MLIPVTYKYMDRKVSIHAPRFQGAMLGASDVFRQFYVVSIHAPRFQGAML